MNVDDRLKAPLSIVRGINPKIIAVSTLGDVLTDIKNQDKQKAEALAQAYKEDPPQYKKLKDSLYGFIAGAFTKRDAEHCTEYVPLIVLDIDGIESEDDTKAIFETVSICAYTFAAFISPSGHGLRILVWCNNTESGHEKAYQQITEFYSKDLDIKTDVELRKAQGKRKAEGAHFDTSAKAFPRFWYYSFNDEFLFINENSKTFELSFGTGDSLAVETATAAVVPRASTTQSQQPRELKADKLTDDIIIEVVEHQLKNRNIASGRNNHVFHFSTLAREHGLDPSVISDYCMKFEEQGFGSAEIAATVKSGIERTNVKFEPIQVLAFYNKMKGVTPGQATPPSVNGHTQPLPAPATPSVKRIDYRATGVYEAKRNDNKFIQMCYYLQKKYVFRFNEVANEVEISLKAQNAYEAINMNGLTCELMEYGLTGVEKNLSAFLGNNNYCPKYDIFDDFFKTLPPWDGVDHIAKLAAYVETSENVDWWNMMFRKALIRTAACSLGLTQNRNCVTLYGGQNAGKTQFLRFLVPPVLKRFFKNGLSNPHTKDGKFEMMQNFIINLDDLDSMSKWDIGNLKSLFSVDFIKERPFFGTSPVIYRRRASFWGSTNKDDILDDDTGNTRWQMIKIVTIKHDNGGKDGYTQNVDIVQLWSQAYKALLDGEKYELTKEELSQSEVKNKSFVKVSHEQELIAKYYEKAAETEKEYFLTTSEIKSELEKVAGLHYSLNIQNLGRALAHLGVAKVTQRNERFDFPVKGYHVRLRPEFTKKDDAGFFPSVEPPQYEKNHTPVLNVPAMGAKPTEDLPF